MFDPGPNYGTIAYSNDERICLLTHDPFKHITKLVLKGGNIHSLLRKILYPFLTSKVESFLSIIQSAKKKIEVAAICVLQVEHYSVR